MHLMMPPKIMRLAQNHLKREIQKNKNDLKQWQCTSGHNDVYEWHFCNYMCIIKRILYVSVKELLHWNNIHDDTWMNIVWTYIMILLFELERHIEVQCRHKLEYDNKWHEHSSEMKMWSTTVLQNDTMLSKIDMWLTTNDAWIRQSSWVTVISTSQYTGMSFSSVIRQSLFSKWHYNGSRIWMRMRERDNGRR